MTYSKPLSDRERALEDAFFREENERLLERMRARREHDAEKEALAGALGLSESGLLEALLELGVRAENVAALMLAPLVAVAWADKGVSDDERRAIHHAEEDHGIDPQSESGELLEIWLNHRPHESLLGAWATYTHELCKRLPADEREKLQQDVVGRARRIARSLEKSLLRSSGPTEAEKQVLTRIEAAFELDGIELEKSSRSSLDDIASSMS